MAEIPSFKPGQLEGIANTLGDTRQGLTGSEIGSLLGQCQIDDPLSGDSKRKRLLEALRNDQKRTDDSASILEFIEAAMDPARYTDDHPKFSGLRYRLNKVLVLCGLELTERGKLIGCDAATTLTEAQDRACRLMVELERRDVHEEVLRFCQREWHGEDYFHAVFEATKSVAERIRQLAGLQADGCDLVDEAFGGLHKGSHRLAINDLATETEESEHKGFMNLTKGMFQAFRNPTAHPPRIKREVTEAEALDLLSLASYLHRRLDQARLNTS